MSFLYNLEDNLKNLESQEEGKDAAERQQRARDLERASAQAIAPYAEALRKSPFTAALLTHATRVGHSLRVKVHIMWLGTTLRLEARERRLELRPTAKGIVTVWLEDGQERRTVPLDLNGNPEDLVRDWLFA
jgi:hypothetical protein